MSSTHKKRISELLEELNKAVEQNLIDSIDHTPEWYQIHVIFPERQPQDTKDKLKQHILQTYRDIVRVETSQAPAILIEYEI